MEVHAIPVAGQFLIYRPRMQLAFVGNEALADLALRLSEDPTRRDAVPTDVLTFLDTIGFFVPDPPAPRPLDLDFRPTSAALLLTNRCDLRCIYCYADAGLGPESDLHLPAALQAIDIVHQNAIEMGLPHFEVTFHGGGEPTQNWEVIREAAAYARRLSLPAKLSIVSNGLWPPSRREWLLTNMDTITVSFDGRPQTQDYQRPTAGGQGSAGAVLSSIRALDEAGAAYGIRMTAIGPWKDTLPEDVRFIIETTKCKTIQVEPAFFGDRGTYRQPEEAEIDAFIAGFIRAHDIASQAGRQLVYSGARPWSTTYTFCNAPFNGLIVDPACNLVGCYEVTRDDHRLSSLARIGRLTSDGVELDHVARSALHSHIDQRHASCQDCFCYWHCAGDCYTRTLVAEGDGLRVTNVRCRINREITAHILLHYVMAGDGVWMGYRNRSNGNVC
jgi:uncharacterized protein